MFIYNSADFKQKHFCSVDVLSLTSNLLVSRQFKFSIKWVWDQRHKYESPLFYFYFIFFTETNRGHCGYFKKNVFASDIFQSGGLQVDENILHHCKLWFHKVPRWRFTVFPPAYPAGGKTAITSVIFFFQNPNLFCDRLGLCKNIDTHNRPSRPSAKALHQNTWVFFLPIKQIYFLVQFAHFCFWSEETQLWMGPARRLQKTSLSLTTLG